MAATQDPSIVVVDPHEEQALRDWYAVEAASIRHDRLHPVHRTFDALAATVRDPHPQRTVLLLAARDADGSTVGVAELAMHATDNPHLAELEVHVTPARRRERIGTALHAEADRVRRAAGRTTVLGELSLDVDDESRAGWHFARSLGFESVHTEDHLVLDLSGRAAEPDSPDADYDVLTWADRCPDAWVTAFLRMQQQMGDDVPTGGVAAAPPTVDEERLRLSEQRSARSYRRLVAVARHLGSDDLVGYSVVFVPHGETDALQDDTLVMPAHRGHGLGRTLKSANLQRLRREHPERVVLHTWTDPDNTAMQATNRRFGFRAAEVMHEMQRID